MYGTGHSQPFVREQVEESLRRLEAVLLRHEQQLRQADPRDAVAELLRGTQAMLREEAERLRRLLAA